MEQKSSLVALLAFLCLSFRRTDGFIWDTFNVERLFKDSETIFPQLRRQLPTEQGKCINEFENFVKDLKLEKTWAITQLGTWGKMPAGLKWGNDVDYGHFDECLSFRHEENYPMEPQHCQLPVTETSGMYGNVTFRIGLCVPDTCTSTSVEVIMRQFLKNIRYDAKEIDPLWCTTGVKPTFGTIQWVATSILIIIAVLLGLSTIYDIYERYMDRKPCPILSSFSMYLNTDKIFQHRSDQNTIECLNGIRVWSTGWIILLHCYRSYDWAVPAMYNRIHVEEYKRTWGYAFMEQGDLAVDSFLLMGGMLIAYNFMQAREKKVPFNILKFYLHRYLRLAPAFLAGVLIVIAFTKYLGDGPAWYMTGPTLEDKCRKYWWSSILMVQNYVNPFFECIGPSWYISMDFQLYLISPLILFPLYKWGYKVFPFAAAATLAASLYVTIRSIQEKFNFFYRTLFWWFKLYYATHCRFGSWLIGILFGYFLFETRNKRIELSKAKILALWAVSIVTCVLCVFVGAPSYINRTNDVVLFGIHQGFHRILWSLALCWVIFACMKGYGGAVNWFFTFPIYQPIAKLCYSVYMLHYPMVLMTKLFQRTPDYYDEYMMLLYTFWICGICLTIAIPWSLAFELPVINLESGVYKKLAQKKEQKREKATAVTVASEERPAQD